MSVTDIDRPRYGNICRTAFCMGEGQLQNWVKLGRRSVLPSRGQRTVAFPFTLLSSQYIYV